MNTVKLLGAVMTVCCGAAVGVAKRKNILEHAEFVSGIAVACEKISTEISLMRTPPVEIFRHLADTATPAGKFFDELSRKTNTNKTTETEWNELLSEFSVRYAISESERSEMDRIGVVLGKYDFENAVSAMTVIGNRLSEMADEAQISAQKDGRVWFSVCTALGAAVALVLF